MSCFTCIPVVDQEHKDMCQVTNSSKNVVILSTEEGVPKEKEVTREGILKLRTGSIAYAWRTVKIVVEYKNILMYEKRNSKPTKILPLHVCSVRPMSTKRFRICCAPNTLVELKVKSNKLMREWVTFIQDRIASRLSTQTECKAHCGMEILAALQKINEANKFCADCHAPDPKWISISIGCIICIECSGVHRHLGTTISKVRSFELDIWDNKNEVIEKIGNADVNTVFEANIFPDHKKPSATSGREEREKYIYNKYVCKLYKRKTSVVHPVLHPQNRQKLSSVQVVPSNERNLMRKRSGSSKPGPAIHIGSDKFSPQLSHAYSKFNPIRRGSFAVDSARRGSFAVDPARRGSFAADSARRGSFAVDSARRGSLASTHASTKASHQRRHSLHQSKLV